MILIPSGVSKALHVDLSTALSIAFDPSLMTWTFVSGSGTITGFGVDAIVTVTTDAHVEVAYAGVVVAAVDLVPYDPTLGTQVVIFDESGKLVGDTLYVASDPNGALSPKLFAFSANAAGDAYNSSASISWNIIGGGGFSILPSSSASYGIVLNATGAGHTGTLQINGIVTRSINLISYDPTTIPPDMTGVISLG